MAADPTGPWAFTDPRSDRCAIPFTDEHTMVIVQQAVESLVLLRSPLQLGDAGATISALVSLAAEIDARIPDAVADARDQDYRWSDIADRLATSVTAARRRYGAYTSWRPPLATD
jgi:hypothetical protein